MELNSIADVKLAGRALVEGWLDGFEDKKRSLINSMFELIQTSQNEELKVKAFDSLVKADAVDLKRRELALKQQEADDNKRLRLLEILQHLPPGTIGKIESGDEDAADIG